MRYLYLDFDDKAQSRRDAFADTRRAKKINNEHRESVSGRRGRPYKNLDCVLNGIWWVLVTGAMWNQMPSRFGKYNSVWRCYSRWCERGLWDWCMERLSLKYSDFSVSVALDATHVKAHQDATRSALEAEDQRLGKTKGGRNTKLSAAVNCVGLALSIRLVPGNEHDSKSALDTLEGHVGDNLVLADKAYDSDKIREYIEERGSIAVIPPRSNRKKPVDYYNALGKTRHEVENFFARIKRYRRVCTRYDRRPDTYMGFATLSALTDWIKFDFVHTA